MVNPLPPGFLGFNKRFEPPVEPEFAEVSKNRIGSIIFYGALSAAFYYALKVVPLTDSGSYLVNVIVWMAGALGFAYFFTRLVFLLLFPRLIFGPEGVTVVRYLWRPWLTTHIAYKDCASLHLCYSPYTLGRKGNRTRHLRHFLYLEKEGFMPFALSAETSIATADIRNHARELARRWDLPLCIHAGPFYVAYRSNSSLNVDATSGGWLFRSIPTVLGARVWRQGERVVIRAGRNWLPTLGFAIATLLWSRQVIFGNAPTPISFFGTADAPPMITTIMAFAIIPLLAGSAYLVIPKQRALWISRKMIVSGDYRSTDHNGVPVCPEEQAQGRVMLPDLRQIFIERQLRGAYSVVAETSAEPQLIMEDLAAWKAHWLLLQLTWLRETA